MNREYLGDGVYCEVDEERGVKLTVTDGLGVTEIIYLGWDVYENLMAYVDRAP